MLLRGIIIGEIVRSGQNEICIHLNPWQVIRPKKILVTASRFW
jgi:hypothetical protein